MSLKGFELRKVAWTVGLVVLGQPALAECTGGGCLDGIVMFFASILGYGIIAIILLVMLARAKWRWAGFFTLGLVILLAVGVPLASQGWQSWKLAAMERREVVGQPPEKLGRWVLLIQGGAACYNDTCMSVLISQGATGAYVLPREAWSDLDLTRPIPLADLPLQHWRAPTEARNEVLRRPLTIVEQQQVAASLTYVVLTAEHNYRSSGGEVEAALRNNPAYASMREGELVRLAMAPLEGSALSLADLRFDLLDLWLVDSALSIPLAPGNWQMANNTTAGLEVAAKVMCDIYDGSPDWGCRRELE